MFLRRSERIERQNSIPFFFLLSSPISSHIRERHVFQWPFPCFSISTYLDFDQRPNIGPMCDCEIVSYAKKDDSTEDQDTIIHGHRSSWRCRWPETEEDNDDHICAGSHVNRDAPNPWDSERTPVQTRLPGSMVSPPTNTASAAAPEKKYAADEVRRVKSANG